MKLKTHKIKLISSIPTLTSLFPHTLGNKHTMEWVKSQREEWKNMSEDEKNSSTSILRCPGIFELYNKGFFIKQPYDVEFKLIDGKLNYIMPNLKEQLKTKPDDINPSKSFMVKKGELEPIFHRNIGSFPFREGTLNVVPKVHTGYTILSSVDLLFLPVPYPDQYEWENSTGILQTNVNQEVNPQLYLNNYQGEKEKTWKINAGDNILFIIPLTSDKWVIETEMTKKEKLFLDIASYIEAGIGKLDGGYMKCPIRNASYANMIPSMKKILNDAYKKLWD